MGILTVVYGLNAMLLLLHEIESAYEKEWEILKLPGKITVFLLLHIPIILLLFYGLLETAKNSPTGRVLCIITGICGAIPMLVHEVFVKRKGRFALLISKAVIYSNAAAGIALAVLSARTLA